MAKSARVAQVMAVAVAPPQRRGELSTLAKQHFRPVDCARNTQQHTYVRIICVGVRTAHDLHRHEENAISRDDVRLFLMETARQLKNTTLLLYSFWIDAARAHDPPGCYVVFIANAGRRNNVPRGTHNNKTT